jgi:hypothetical protein
MEEQQILSLLSHSKQTNPKSPESIPFTVAYGKSRIISAQERTENKTYNKRKHKIK